jgi:hypothetical protein
LDALKFTAGLLLIVLTLIDGFETMLLPRRISYRFRYSRFYYRGAWKIWRRAADGLQSRRWREAILGIFGPLSLLGLFGSWMASLVLGFALLQWSTANPLMGPHAPREPDSFWDCLYFSGTTCFTLGLGDLTPRQGLARFYTVAESGVGFGFLAIIIGYLPVLYQAFSRREVQISLLDARAGSPPSGGEYMLRLARDGRYAMADDFLREWERWCAELLESHVSFPVLTYYRSQHANQSWLAALATMLDASALMLTLLPPRDSYQAQLTFAMARHAAVDICLIFSIRPCEPMPDRLSPENKDRLRELLKNSTGAGPLPALANVEQVSARMVELRELYEPFLAGLADRFLLALPPLLASEHTADNWQRSAWMPRTPGIGSLPAPTAGRSDADHF